MEPDSNRKYTLEGDFSFFLHTVFRGPYEILFSGCRLNAAHMGEKMSHTAATSSQRQ